MNKIKTATHWIAGVLGTAVGGILTFAATPAGQAIIKQYPKVSVFVTLLTMAGTVFGVYYQPKQVPPIN